MIEEMKLYFGPKCTGINLNPINYHCHNIPDRKMKFCEAISYSFVVPIEINQENISCPGARRNLGYDIDEMQLSKTISGNTNIPASFIHTSLSNIPHLDKKNNRIVLGISKEIEKEVEPDFFVIYTTPQKIMQTIHTLAMKEVHPTVSPYSLLSVCGNVFVRGMSNNQVTISFGCPESRKFGGIDKNEVVIGIPKNLAMCFINNN